MVVESKYFSFLSAFSSSLRPVCFGLCALGLTTVAALPMAAQQRVANVRVKLVNQHHSNEALPLAPVQLNPLGLTTSTDAQGVATFDRLPVGRYKLSLSYIGYVPRETSLNLQGDTTIVVALSPTSLSLGEAVVTATRNQAGNATASTIGRRAIDHLQATSLADVLQLVPGQLMGNADMTQRQSFQLRTLTNNANVAFGTNIIVDGIPLSNNGALSQGGFNAAAPVGTDLRQIGADDIESVEVVRGIASAEYGDLTSGMVIVHSRSGVSPWQWKSKVNPGLMNHSLSKGFRLGKGNVVNAHLDYAQAWGDPRMKTRSFHRYTLSLGWAKNWTHAWHTDTKLRWMGGRDWTGNDADAAADGTSSENAADLFSLAHNGRIQVGKPLMRTLTYALGVQYAPTNAENTTFVGSGTGLIPLLTAQETGYHTVKWRTTSYRATGRTEGRPLNLFAKLNNSMFFHTGRLMQTIKMGVEYKYDRNFGKGFYNLDDEAPLRPNSNGRPRAFYEVPGLHQAAAFVDDQWQWRVDEVRRVKLQTGLRFTALQPWSEIRAFSLSPRVNFAFNPTKWLELRVAFGRNSKTPSLDYLYPDRNHTDRVAASYMPQDAPQQQFLLYHTDVYKVAYAQLENATATKWEAGLDITLPKERKISLTAYIDRTLNGFSNYTEYRTYEANFFTPEQGLRIESGKPTTFDAQNPARRDLIFVTTGRMGNFNVADNRGIEVDFDLGKIKPLHTTLFLSSAYQWTKTYDSEPNYRTPAALPTHYTQFGLTPIKLRYPAALDFSSYDRFVQTLRIVTHLPVLRMVASLTGQVIWHNAQLSCVAPKQPIAWLDQNLVEHPITSNMRSGFIGTDGRFYATKPTTQAAVALAAQDVAPRDNVTTSSPTTWNLSFRLTKELGSLAQLSFYVNNALYYEPFLPTSTSTTLSQRNTGSFSFGAELSFQL